MPTDPEPINDADLDPETAAYFSGEPLPGEVLGEMAGDLAAVSAVAPEEAEEVVAAAVEELGREPSTFKEIAVFILEALREGAMWAGWSEDGVPAFGDFGDEVPAGVTVEHAAEELAILAGVMALDTVQKAKAKASTPKLNREQRRAAARAARRRL